MRKKILTKHFPILIVQWIAPNKSPVNSGGGNKRIITGTNNCLDNLANTKTLEDTKTSKQQDLIIYNNALLETNKKLFKSEKLDDPLDCFHNQRQQNWVNLNTIEREEAEEEKEASPTKDNHQLREDKQSKNHHLDEALILNGNNNRKEFDNNSDHHKKQRRLLEGGR